MNRHLSEDELIDRLYGVGDGAHMDDCPECASRFQAMQSRRTEVAAPVAVSTEYLAAQRRQIYAQTGEKRKTHLAWVPALAAACLLAVGVFVYHPAQPVVSHPDTADEQLFSDVYSMSQSTEPIAAEPFHALFEDNQ